jgi:formylglycine-generating enzyme required for sulfatase activity
MPRDPVVLAFGYYALRENRVHISRPDFFSRFWRPMPTIPHIPTVTISLDQGPIRFMMGCADDVRSDAHPRHEVELSPYCIGETPVTLQEFEPFLGRQSASTVPIVDVTWWESWIFCKWLGGELPTEAQWECACRAGTSSSWWCGDDETRLRQVAWVDEGDDGDAHPVRLKAANPWGLFDVHGNVSEWCFDRYGHYVPGRNTDPVGPAFGATRVLRGGNAAAPTDFSRSARRDHANPLSKSLVTGFRVVLGRALGLRRRGDA